METPTKTPTMSRRPATPEAYKAVGSKIAKIMAEAPRLEKSGRNAHHNYRYAPIEAYMDALQQLMAKHGLIYLHEHGGTPTVEKQGNMKLYTWPFTVWLVDTDSGQFLEFHLTALARDGEDKAPGKAISLVTKYFLGATFMMVAEDAEQAAPDQAAPHQSGGRNRPQNGRQNRRPNGTAQAANAPRTGNGRTAPAANGKARKNGTDPDVGKALNALRKALREHPPEGFLEYAGQAAAKVRKWPNGSETGMNVIGAETDRYHGRHREIDQTITAIGEGIDPEDAIGALNDVAEKGNWPSAWREYATELIAARFPGLEPVE